MMRRTTMMVVLVLVAVIMAAVPADAELRSEPWACFARGYIIDLASTRVLTAPAARSIRGRIQSPAQVPAETLYSFGLYEIAQDEWGMYLRGLVYVTDVDEGFASMLAKAAGGEVAVELANFGGKCPVDGRALRGVNEIRLLDYDLEPVPVPPTPPTDGGGRG